jgi:hypothetical protein
MPVSAMQHRIGIVTSPPYKKGRNLKANQYQQPVHKGLKSYRLCKINLRVTVMLLLLLNIIIDYESVEKEGINEGRHVMTPGDRKADPREFYIEKIIIYEVNKSRTLYNYRTISNKHQAITNGNIIGTNTLKLVQWNKGRKKLNTYIDSLEVLIAAEKPDILCVSESMLGIDDDPEDVRIDGYDCEHASTGDEVGLSRNCIYICKTLVYVRRNDLEESPISTVWIELTIPGESNILIMGGYRQFQLPNQITKISLSYSHQAARWAKYLKQWDTALKEQKEVIVCADDNIDSTHWSSNLNTAVNPITTKNLYLMLRDMILSQGVEVMNHEPTRKISEHVKGTIIDHIYSNQPEKIKKVFTKSHGGSDHRIVGVLWQSKSVVHPPAFLRTRKEHLVTEIQLQHLVRSNNLMERILELDDINKAAELFIKEYESYLNVMAPMRIIQCRKKYAQWVSEEERLIIQKRKDAYDDARRIDTGEQWRLYRSVNNKVNKELKAAKRKWLYDKMSRNSDVKEVWKTAKAFWDQDSQGPPKALKIAGIITTKASLIADELNLEFIRKVQRLRQGTASSQRKDPLEMLRQMKPRAGSTLKLNQITFSQTRNLISSFSNSHSRGVDDINITNIKKGGTQVVIIIKHLINLSLKNREVPNIIKTSRISPILKSGKEGLSAASYRPINNLSIIAKLIDRHVFSQLSNYLEKHNIIDDNHHGGRCGHSTTTAMLQIYNKLAEIRDQGNAAAILAVDLSAAFDLCDHSIMLGKMEHYGVRGHELEWFTNYFQGRTQCVQVGKYRTQLHNLPPCSVIQGGVGSGILYTLYTNDLPCVIPYNVQIEAEKGTNDPLSKNDETINFVDDSTTVISATEPRALVSRVEKYYGWLMDYFIANFMTINADKTAVMVIASTDRKYIMETMTFNIDNFIIKPKQVFKLLGYFLNSNLSHEVHLISGKDSLLKRLYARLRVLRRLSKYTDKRTRLLIANAIFNGTLTYLMPLWSSADVTTILKIHRVQMQAARTIIGHPCYRQSTEKILNQVKWMSTMQMLTEKSTVLMHAIATKSIPKSLSKIFEFKKNDQRTRTPARIERIDGFIERTEFLRTQFNYKTRYYFNQLPPELKDLDKKEFKTAIKIHIKETIPVKGNQLLM